MYELVNTSLPNGLIAGTHGFATAAMTKGIPDILRGRLETLCAYTHRTSVHDETYYRQNPVNWFHVTLPLGEHVVGRVAPSEFDYTGRTNRLARLRTFNAAEMPSAGGAEILNCDKNWFSAPWQGDPKYLEENKEASTRIRALNPSQNATCPTWDKIFGNNGTHLAQQIAWQLEKNITSGSKSIYFKTSSDWDVSGEKLLALFSEVINLLPAEIRPQVTFSTYPVSLPGGTTCSLRGIFDRDKFFDATSATQAWVDCENAKIVHSELLPTAPASAIQTESTKAAETPVSFAADAKGNKDIAAQSNIRNFPRPTVNNGRTARPDFLPQEKKGPDMLIIGAVAIGVIVLLAAGGTFFWMANSNKKQMQDSGAAEALGKLEQIKIEKEQTAQEQKLKTNAEEERAAKEAAERQNAELIAKANKEMEERQKREKEEAEKAKKDAELAAAKAKENAEKLQKEQTAFVNAVLEGEGVPEKPKTGPVAANKAPLTFKVFYYTDNGTALTNEIAGYHPLFKPGNKNLITDYSLYVREPKLKLTLLDKSPVVLWMSNDKLWFDWSRHTAKSETWFKDSDSHDLQKDCFGPSEEVFDAWHKSHPVTYVISWGEEKGQWADWEKRDFTIKDAVETIYAKEKDRIWDEILNARKEIQNNDEKIKKTEAEIADCDRKKVEYNTEKAKLDKLIADQEALVKKRKQQKKDDKFKGDVADNYKKNNHELSEKITTQQRIVDALNNSDVESEKNAKQAKINKLKEEIHELEEKLSNLGKQYDDFKNNNDHAAEIKSMSFKVSIKGIN